MKHTAGIAGTCLQQHGYIAEVYTNAYLFRADNGAQWTTAAESDFDPDVSLIWNGGYTTDDGIPDGGDCDYSYTDKDGNAIEGYMGD